METITLKDADMILIFAKFYDGVEDKSILIGKKARSLYNECLELLEEQKLGHRLDLRLSGMFKENGKFIVFDNTAGECFVEETDSFIGAAEYLVGQEAEIRTTVVVEETKEVKELEENKNVIHVEYLSSYIMMLLQGYTTTLDARNIVDRDEFSEYIYKKYPPLTIEGEKIYPFAVEGFNKIYRDWATEEVQYRDDVTIVECMDQPVFIKETILNKSDVLKAIKDNESKIYLFIFKYKEGASATRVVTSQEMCSILNEDNYDELNINKGLTLDKDSIDPSDFTLISVEEANLLNKLKLYDLN